ncbi:MAG: hypothetical protein ACLQBC_06110 [Syntrophales bacterium]
MARITLKTIIKITEIISSVAVVIINTLNGGKKNDRTGNSKKK